MVVRNLSTPWKAYNKKGVVDASGKICLPAWM